MWHFLCGTSRRASAGQRTLDYSYLSTNGNPAGEERQNAHYKNVAHNLNNVISKIIFRQQMPNICIQSNLFWKANDTMVTIQILIYGLPCQIKSYGN